jgi:hypothetical protein
MKLKTEYDIEQIVYIRADPDQLPHTIIGIIIEPGAVRYKLSYLGDIFTLYNFEISKEKTIILDHPPADEED